MKMELGVQIDIQRSDGRVHPATISGIDGLNVTVEWFEFGETKGKEINLDQVYSLNPALQPKSQIKQPPPSRRQSVPQNNAVNNVKDVRKKVASPAPRSRSLRSKSMIPPPNAAKNSKIAYMPKSDVTVSHDDTVLHQQRPAEKENSKPSTVSQSTRDRRSNCVKEVERLKKNREDRRARQTEIKKEQIKVQAEIDPGNPNWHFLKMIRDYEQSLGDHEAITMHDAVVDHQICVCVRKRPINKKEINKKDIDIITPVDREHIVVHECKLKVDLTKYLDNQKFRFDYSFDENASNELVYRYTAKPLVDSIFNGGMATCFAYGQTGSGKTHTMGGDFTSTKQQDCSKGIYALAATDIFKLQKSKYKHLDLIVSASFFEIYSGKEIIDDPKIIGRIVFDLMNKRKKLRVLEDGKAQVQIPELAENVVTCLEDVLKVLDTGLKTRTSGVTSANQNSSRSHAIFQLVLRKRGHGKDGSMGSLHGKFSLIDLAGNERGADTISADRQTRREGAEINKSLLALKECIRALGRKGAHLPFRASKLTQVLRDSFIGETSKTCMIAMISPCMSCSENSLNTLRYADRVKELRCDEVSSKEKKVLNLDYPDEVEEEPPANLSNSNHQYRNPELAMLCTKSSREMLKSSIDPDSKDKKSIDQEETRHNSDDLYNFHEAVSLLMESEEQVIDEHKSSMEENYNYLEEEKKLLERIENDVDCDVEEYVHRLDLILMEKIDKFTALREKVSQFKEQLFEEEKASKNVRRLPFV